MSFLLLTTLTITTSYSLFPFYCYYIANKSIPQHSTLPERPFQLTKWMLHRILWPCRYHFFLLILLLSTGILNYLVMLHIYEATGAAIIGRICLIALCLAGNLLLSLTKFLIPKLVPINHKLFYIKV